GAVGAPEVDDYPRGDLAGRLEQEVVAPTCHEMGTTTAVGRGQGVSVAIRHDRVLVNVVVEDAVSDPVAECDKDVGIGEGARGLLLMAPQPHVAAATVVATGEPGVDASVPLGLVEL